MNTPRSLEGVQVEVPRARGCALSDTIMRCRRFSRARAGLKFAKLENLPLSPDRLAWGRIAKAPFPQFFVPWRFPQSAKHYLLGYGAMQHKYLIFMVNRVGFEPTTR